MWAIEQDNLSKRSIPQSGAAQSAGQDVFVPWVLASQTKAKQRNPRKGVNDAEGPQRLLQAGQVDAELSEQKPAPVFNRYYHMFAKGELTQLVQDAAEAIGLVVGSESKEVSRGIEIAQNGWERSNYYVEIRRWECKRA